MGGTTFQYTHPNLKLPRMPHDEYDRRVQWALEKLRTLFVHVACPPESPGKIDHGDIDTIVSGWKISSRQTSADEVLRLPNGTEQFVYDIETFGNEELQAQIKALFKPKVFRQQKNFPIVNLAIPVDPNDEQTTYFQVDIDIYSAKRFDWLVFKNSYGDLHSIVSTAIKEVGLRWRDAGLALAAEEGQSRNQWKSVDPNTMIVLTNEPRELLEFLGLDYETFLTGWDTEEEFFTYLAGMRFMMPDAFAAHDPKRRQTVGESAETLKKQKDLAKRKVFQRFVLEFFPTLTVSDRGWTKESVRQLALETFPGFRISRGEWIGIDDWHAWWRKNDPWAANESIDKFEKEQDTYNRAVMKYCLDQGIIGKGTGWTTKTMLWRRRDAFVGNEKRKERREWRRRGWWREIGREIHSGH